MLTKQMFPFCTEAEANVAMTPRHTSPCSTFPWDMTLLSSGTGLTVSVFDAGLILPTDWQQSARGDLRMDDTYSENRSYWANSEPKQQVSKPGSKVLGEAQHEKETGIDQDSFEPLRLTFDSPAANRKVSSDQHPASITASPQHSDTSLGEALHDATPTASLVGGVQTPDLPEQLAEHAGSQVLRATTIQASFFPLSAHSAW